MIKELIIQNIKKYKFSYLKTIILTIIITILISITAPFLVKDMIDDNILSNSHWKLANKGEILINNKQYEMSKNENDAKLTRDKNSNYYLDNKKLNNSDKQNVINLIYKKSFYKLYIFFACFLVAALLMYIADLNIATVARKSIYDLRSKSLKKLFELPISYFDNNSDGEILTKIINDTDTYYRLVLEVGNIILNSFIVYISITFTTLFISIPLFIIALFMIPITIVWIKLYVKKVVSSFELQRDSLEHMNSLTNEQIKGIDIIKTYQQEKTSQNKFNKFANNYYNASKKALITESLFSWTLVTFLQRAFILAVITYFGFNILNEKIVLSAGLAYLIIYFINSITYPLLELIHMLNGYNSIMVSIKRVSKYLQEPTNKSNKNDIKILNSKIDFKNVSFKYNNKYILENFNISFLPNKRNAIVGATGSGKSTIISLIMRFYDINSGSIYIDDKNIDCYSKKSLRNNIGLVLQKTYLFEGTIYENIVFYDYTIKKEEVMQLVTIARADFIINNPLGLEMQISESSNNLSMGEKQIIALLRALIKKPKILILDEASSNLDMESENAINNLINHYSKDTTITIVAHRVATIANSDMIYVIDNGKLVEQGNHQQLMNENTIYYKNIQAMNS
ncbi:ABC transporter ATP-binding protein [Mycoplasma sp. P36-A1]|uniref:ABC transporter ATP-binding protein n=1 Tax=Mycoplasma sp. P36-A1 TaxID=3252900 RepID=UPI003C306826